MDRVNQQTPSIGGNSVDFSFYLSNIQSLELERYDKLICKSMDFHDLDEIYRKTHFAYVYGDGHLCDMDADDIRT